MCCNIYSSFKQVVIMLILKIELDQLYFIINFLELGQR